MHASFRILCLAPLACVLAFAGPARADLASPQRDIRKARVVQWHQKYPGTVPDVKLSLEPGGKTLLLRFESRTPASFSPRTEGGDPVARVEDLKGGVQTMRVPLDALPGGGGRWTLHVDYTLKGVRAEGSKLAETGDSIGGCLRRRFAVEKAGEGFQLKLLPLGAEDYYHLRGCEL